MLKGIDISNWQDGLDISKLDIDFAIMKATEGCGLVDRNCDAWIEQCKKNNILWGFYHFARNNEPEDDADFFYKNTRNYFTHGIPVLDIETESIKNWANWSQRFVDRIHALSGVYPLIYTSAAYTERFTDTTLPETCGLWVAGYPRKYSDFDSIPDFNYGIKPWPFCAIWQFTGNGRVKGYNYDLDLDVAFMDRDAWMKYANPEGNTHDGNTGVIPIPKEQHVFEDDAVKVVVTLKS